MRFTPRLFLAAIALITTTAFVRAQDSAAPVPPPAQPNAAVKPLPRPAQKSSVQVSASFEHIGAAASVASLGIAKNTSPAKGVEVLPPAGKTSTSGWTLLGLMAVGLFINITRYRRGLPKRHSFAPIANLPLAAEPVPVAVPVPARLN